MGSEHAPGLRERSKSRRRRSIVDAALHLFAANGYDATTVAQVAAAADVAPRTVAGYFATKADLALAVPDGIADRLTTALRTAPDADFVDVIDRWLAAELQGSDFEQVVLVERVFAGTPELRGRSSASFAAAIEAGHVALVRKLGLPDDDPMVPVVGESIRASIGAYFAAVVGGADAEELRPRVVRHLRRITTPDRRRSAT